MQSAVETQNYFTRLIGRYSIAKKLMAGFGLILIMLAGTVVFIDIKLIGIGETQDRIVNLRMPTNVAGHDLVNGINSSLAALRGYMILDDSKFKQQRQQAWQQIDDNLDLLESVSKHWTEVENQQRFEDLKDVLLEFRRAQDHVERVSHSAEEQPAMQILLTEAAPIAAKIVTAITSIIEEEKSLPATDKRKALLGELADSRGAFALGLAAIRAYLISGDEVWIDDFKQKWQINTERLETIKRKQSLFNEQQKIDFDSYTGLRDEFASLPSQMFEIRKSNKWNKASFLLMTEAAPKAEAALFILDSMVESQSSLVAVDAQHLQEQNDFLRWMAYLMAFIAIVVGSTIAWFVTRAVVEPITKLTATLIDVSKKSVFNKRVEITSNDELGQSANAFNLLMESMELAIQEVSAVMSKLAAGDSSTRINADLQGDLAKLKEDTNASLGLISKAEAERMVLEEQAESSRSKALVLAQETTRIKRALDVCQANVMMVDMDFNIIYTNDALVNMMQGNESEIRAVLPSFQATNLVGTRADDIHNNPEEQRNVLAGISQSYSNELKLAGVIFTQTATPVFDVDGARLGIVLEWEDRTMEVAVQNEIDNIVRSAVGGDLSQRISLENKTGFYENLGSGLNQLVTVAEDIVLDTARVLAAMAHGKLTEKIDNDYQGLFGKLKQDANATVDKLTEALVTIRESSRSVSQGAVEIAQGNSDLSQRTEEQAASLEETASSMERMTNSVRTSAGNAEHVNQLAKEASDIAQLGGDVVNRAIVAMSEINASSNKIADIIGVIDEIAFQTNLLALNAAVEAARAGEQGRGFAVVASEVRTLAQRSAGAAKEIKGLIRDSIVKVNAGSTLVNDSGKTLNDIMTAVGNVSGMIAEISSESQEQMLGISQVNQAVSHLDDMTQQNAALVEQASAAGETMAEQSREMTKLVGFFTLGF